jgi:hypothetical protein
MKKKKTTRAVVAPTATGGHTYLFRIDLWSGARKQKRVCSLDIMLIDVDGRALTQVAISDTTLKRPVAVVSRMQTNIRK